MAIEDIVAWAFLVPIVVVLWLCLMTVLIAVVTFCLGVIDDLWRTGLVQKIAQEFRNRGDDHD